MWKNLCTHYFLLLNCGAILKELTKINLKRIKNLSKMIYKDFLKIIEKRVDVAPTQQKCLTTDNCPTALPHTQRVPVPFCEG